MNLNYRALSCDLSTSRKVPKVSPLLAGDMSCSVARENVMLCDSLISVESFSDESRTFIWLKNYSGHTGLTFYNMDL